MRYRTFVFTVIILFSFQLYSQDKNSNLRLKVQQHRNDVDSLEYYAQRLYDTSSKNNDVRNILNALMALGSVEMRKNNLQKSNVYYHKLISIANKNDRSSFGYGAMSNLAINHRRLQRNDSAFYYFKKVNGFYSQNDFKMPANQAKMNLGISYLQYQELDSAYYYLRLSLKGFSVLNNQRFVAQNQSLLAEVYYQKENYDKAIELADSSLVVSNQINFKPNLARNYSLLSRSYEKLGDSLKANEYALLEEQNMVNRAQNAIVGRLNEKYEAEMRERRQSRFDEVSEDKNFFKSNLFAVALICVFLIVTSLLLMRRNRMTKLEVLELQQLVNQYVKSNSKSEKHLTKLQNTIVLKNKAVIKPEEILYIKSDGHYIDYFLVDKENPETVRNTLTKALKILPPALFSRIHRSYIVNIEHIKIINSTQLMLDNGEWIPLSRTFKSRLKDLLNKT